MDTKKITEVERVRVMSHLKYWCKGEPSEAGIAVAALLEAWQGLHHMDSREMSRADWTNPRFVEIKCRTMPLSTFDFDDLTRLVFLAHDRCIRVDVSPSMKYARILFHPRQREGGMSERHPTLECAVEKWRLHNPAEPSPEPAGIA